MFNNFEKKRVISKEKTAGYFVDFSKILEECSLREKELKSFGVKAHGVKINPVAGEEEILKFEKKFGMKLPEDFRYFLKNVGNGCTTPGFSVFSISQIEDHMFNFFNQKKEEPLFFDETLTREKWVGLVDKIDESCGHDEILLIREMMAGTIDIGTFGDSYDLLLTCRGNTEGSVIFFDWSFIKNNEPKNTVSSFEEWLTGNLLSYMKENDDQLRMFRS